MRSQGFSRMATPSEYAAGGEGAFGFGSMRPYSASYGRSLDAGHPGFFTQYGDTYTSNQGAYNHALTTNSQLKQWRANVEDTLSVHSVRINTTAARGNNHRYPPTGSPREPAMSARPVNRGSTPAAPHSKSLSSSALNLSARRSAAPAQRERVRSPPPPPSRAQSLRGGGGQQQRSSVSAPGDEEGGGGGHKLRSGVQGTSLTIHGGGVGAAAGQGRPVTANAFVNVPELRFKAQIPQFPYNTTNYPTAPNAPEIPVSVRDGGKPPQTPEDLQITPGIRSSFDHPLKVQPFQWPTGNLPHHPREPPGPGYQCADPSPSFPSSATGPRGAAFGGDVPPVVTVESAGVSPRKLRGMRPHKMRPPQLPGTTAATVVRASAPPKAWGELKAPAASGGVGDSSAPPARTLLAEDPLRTGKMPAKDPPSPPSIQEWQVSREVTPPAKPPTEDQEAKALMSIEPWEVRRPYGDELDKPPLNRNEAEIGLRTGCAPTIFLNPPVDPHTIMTNLEQKMSKLQDSIDEDRAYSEYGVVSFTARPPSQGGVSVTGSGGVRQSKGASPAGSHRPATAEKTAQQQPSVPRGGSGFFRLGHQMGDMRAGSDVPRKSEHRRKRVTAVQAQAPTAVVAGGRDNIGLNHEKEHRLREKEMQQRLLEQEQELPPQESSESHSEHQSGTEEEILDHDGKPIAKKSDMTPEATAVKAAKNLARALERQTGVEMPSGSKGGGAALVRAFKAMDTDGNGKITRSEFEDWVYNIGALKPYAVDALFAVLDQDDSGAIDYKEFARLLVLNDIGGRDPKRYGINLANKGGVIQTVGAQKRHAALNKTEVKPEERRLSQASDKKAFLEREKQKREETNMEVSLYLAKLKMKMRNNPMLCSQKLFKTCSYFDQNGDGKISAGELQSVMETMGLPIRKDLVKRMVETYDTDRNGYLEYGELMQMFYPSISIYKPQ